MVKRRRRSHDADNLPAKRLCASSCDRLSSLSDELVLNLLSYLPASDLVHCERLSRRISLLAKDSQLWKSAYYSRFVLPRAIRIPGLRSQGTFAKSLSYSSKLSKWLEDDYLVHAGQATNWKRQYKIKHNWSKGSCKVKEMKIAERPSALPMLVQLCNGIVVTCDSVAGLRAWSVQGECRPVGTMRWSSIKQPDQDNSNPTSMAIDTSNSFAAEVCFSVGFLDGSFGVFCLDQLQGSFVRKYLHAASSNGAVTAIAFSYPYVLTMTEVGILSLYILPTESPLTLETTDLKPPKLLYLLKSHTAWPPLSLAIRSLPTGVSASIAYAMPTYPDGWSVGLQELRLNSDGSVVTSRGATAFSQGFYPLHTVYKAVSSSLTSGMGIIKTNTPEPVAASSKPTSLSYSHPYLLTTHPDNTLTLYMVTSNATELSIAMGVRLWGHTSSVSGAYVSNRGKAVSISNQGSELRIWELEGGFSSNPTKQRSVQLQPALETSQEQSPLSERSNKINKYWGHTGAVSEDGYVSNGWIAFDEEMVVTLREKLQGHQALVMYDFA
ncbi:MAG: hypothetical protein Q9167_001382 [Letrouitia subvulpina]